MSAQGCKKEAGIIRESGPLEDMLSVVVGEGTQVHVLQPV